MIPERLQIRGFLSYHDPVDLDFSGIDLACISGSNGAGKSSLLDAITWALFGEARRRDDAIINHRTQKENGPAEVILDFDYEDARYRVQRSKQKDKVTALDFFILAEDEGWKPLTEATMRATEERIRQTLRLDYETFINASFFLQGKADQFAQQRPADRKRILASILGLEMWEEYKEAAAQRRKQSEKDLAVCEGILTEINNELAEEEQRKADLAQLQKEYDTRSELAQANRKILDQQRLIGARLESEKAQLEKQSAEISRLQAELDQKVDDLRERQEEQRQFRVQLESENEIQAGYKGWLDLQKKLTAMDAIAADFHQFELKRQQPLLKIESERAAVQAELKSLTAREAEIKTLETGLPELTQQVAESEQTIQACESQLALRSVLEEDVKGIREEKARAQAENAVLKAEMDDLESRRKTLREAAGAACPTCEKPLEPEDRQRIIDDLTARGTAKAEVYRRNLKILEGCETDFREKETSLGSLQRVEAELKLQQRLFDSKSAELKRAQAELEKWQNDGLSRLENLRGMVEKEDYATEAQKELDALDAELKKLGYDASAHAELKAAEAEARTFQEQKNGLDQARSALAPLEREIESLEKSMDAAEAHLQKMRQEFRDGSQDYEKRAAETPDLAGMERGQRDLQEEVNNLLTRVGYARNRVDVLKQVREQKSAKEAEKLKILNDIAQLKMLEKAFGKDGIPALLIEQALPEIEMHANEVLDQLSGGLMRLSFVTQREYRDAKREDRKETLDIIISSSAEERAYELFSGGEAFRINFAVRLALSRMLASRAGARLQTLVIDEGFGSQDAEGRQRLIEAINFVRDKFARIIVITHLEELKDAFSARIEVTKTPNGSQVQVVAA